MKKSRLTALLLTLVLALSLTIPAAAYNNSSLVPQKRTYSTPFTDTEGTWCDAYVRTCYEAGLLDGTSKTSFAPTASLTYAQIVVITARLHELLNSGDGKFDAPASGQPWYQPAASYLAAQVDEDSDAGDYLSFFLAYSLDSYAQSPCSRFEFVWFLAAVLPQNALTAINAVTSLPDVTDSDVLRFYNAGILTGSNEYGTFNGWDHLNRGQAAAMLARIIDPAQRVKFTPKALVASQELLGLQPDETVLTVDGFDISAELYTYFLTSNISYMEFEAQYSYYDEYPEYYEDWVLDEEFFDSFADYLTQHGVEINTSVDWNTPDKGGMTPAEKVLEDTLQDVKFFACLINHQSEYPLTAAQRSEIQGELYQRFGYSAALSEQMLTYSTLVDNLAARQIPNASQLKKFLEEQGYICGLEAVFYRGMENGSYTYLTDAKAKEAAENFRKQMNTHLDDSEYQEYLVWKYSDSYDSTPTLISLSDLSAANQSTLKSLGSNKVSPILTEQDRYVVVLKLDPSHDEDINELTGYSLATVQVEQWAESALVTTAPAYHSVDVAKAAAVYDRLGI